MHTVTVLALLLSVTAAVQEVDDSVGLELSAGSGAPGSVVVLPLILRLYEEQSIEQIEVRVELPSPSLELKAVRLGNGLDEEKSKVSFELEPSNGQGAVGVIQLESETPFPEGEVARLVIQIAEEAGEESFFLVTKARVWDMGSTQDDVREVTTLDGILVASEGAGTPAMGCFFYMH